MRIDLGENFWKIDIPKTEKYYGAKYIGDFPVIENGVFHSEPVSVFYRPKDKVTPNNHQYVGMWKPDLDGHLSVFNAGYIKDYIFNGLEQDNVVLYSRYEEDKREFPDGSSITGGWCRCETDGPQVNKVRLQVVDGIITILPPKSA